MADFLTDCPGDSGMLSEQESWKPVDASEPELEKKMEASLTTKPKEEEPEPAPVASTSAALEADFSEPEEVTGRVSLRVRPLYQNLPLLCPRALLLHLRLQLQRHHRREQKANLQSSGRSCVLVQTLILMWLRLPCPLPISLLCPSLPCNLGQSLNLDPRGLRNHLSVMIKVPSQRRSAQWVRCTVPTFSDVRLLPLYDFCLPSDVAAPGWIFL